MRDGYKQKAAFKMVEKEMQEYFDREREEISVVKGIAFDNKATSYLSYA